ncbi:MAG TPA: serine/threonine-protein kinase [Vicinamibacteria bacterium]|nr:serine/threonine-protein kinase [Vicinamibacteria bacterium]
MSSNPAAPEPTEIAGRYQVVQKLGAGAMGTVFKARDRVLGRMTAIKTIRLEGLAASQASLEDLLKRFKQEAEVAAQLKHPNIVTIYDIGTTEGLSYISMEFVDGVGLDRVIAKAGKMSVERAAAIGAQVADALAYAHKHNVVHRDIKPANIMIEPGDHVKVTDFGIAKVTDSAEHLTATGSLLGTPSYMSPQQARGEKIDGKSDLFSLGCILYEMMAGQKAFRGETLTAIMFKIITEEPPSLRTLDPTVSDEMLRVIAKSLAKDDKSRYQTGRELADDLLALTRPGFVPTLRAAETPTLAPDTPPGDVPTIASPPTARGADTLSSAATAARSGATSSTQPTGAPPPLPPTVLTPPTRTEPPPLPTKAAPPSRPPQPPVAPAARRKGGGAGLVVGIGLAAVLVLAVVAGGAWVLLGRRAAPAEPSPSPEARVAETPVPPATLPATPAPAEAAPSAAPVTPLPATPVPDAGPRVASAGPRPGPGRDRSGPAAPVAPPPATAPAAGAKDYAFLDDVPTETDGRAAGEDLAHKYSSGGSSGYPSARYPRRQRVPHGVTMPERPAVATLLYLHSVQEAYHRKSGHYGNLRDLAAAGLLVLDVPFDASGFRRAHYAFTVTSEAEGYRAEAMPQGPIGRALLVDDSGFVRWRDE